MKGKYCHVALVGHHDYKLKLTIDKEIVNKIIFITESERRPGTAAAMKALKELTRYYENRKIEVCHVKFDFNIQTKPIAQLVHLIRQQELEGYDQLSVNISSGLRDMVVWFYIACSITQTKIIHADFVYEGTDEVGINYNAVLITIPLPTLTKKQVEFIELFFRSHDNFIDFFKKDLSFNENPLLRDVIRFDSIEKLKDALEAKRNERITRGSINGFIQKLNKLSALDIGLNQDDKKEKTITLSYVGIAMFLNELYIEKVENGINNAS